MRGYGTPEVPQACEFAPPLPKKQTQACDVPLEPVFDNPADGSLSVPKYNYREKRADWQAAIDAAQPRQHWGAPVKSLLEVD